MRAPGFWSKPVGVVAAVLAPAGLLYGQVTAWRMSRGGVRVPVPVICVGNFVAGGAGKTPVALALGRWLAEAGWRPGFLSRGYGGRLPGPVTVDPSRHGFEDVGDEPLLLARVAPVTVARDRIAGARHAIAHGANILVMDDGLQNPSLRKDLRIAVVDAALGSGNGLCVPAGPLRAPLPAQWPHVDAVVVIGQGDAGDALAQTAERAGKAVLRGSLVHEDAVASALRAAPVFAFAGIGRPDKFFATLAGTGALLCGSRAFPDHHPFTGADMTTLRREATRVGATLVTTEKDWVRIPAGHRAGIEALPVTLAWDAGDMRDLLAQFAGGPRPPGPTQA